MDSKSITGGAAETLPGAWRSSGDPSIYSLQSLKESSCLLKVLHTNHVEGPKSVLGDIGILRLTGECA